MSRYSQNFPHRTLPSLTGRSLRAVVPAKSALRRVTLKDSCFAAAFLSVYLATYLAVGFAVVGVVEWAWAKLVA
jgi:hypothetical protein